MLERMTAACARPQQTAAIQKIASAMEWLSTVRVRRERPGNG
jgi:hypothetical protein